MSVQKDLYYSKRADPILSFYKVNLENIRNSELFSSYIPVAQELDKWFFTYFRKC